MRAEMHERVDIFEHAQAAIEGEIAVARGAFGVVIEALAVEAVTAVGLKRDEDLSGAQSFFLADGGEKFAADVFIG